MPNLSSHRWLSRTCVLCVLLWQFDSFLGNVESIRLQMGYLVRDCMRIWMSYPLDISIMY